VVSTILARQCGNGNFEWYKIDDTRPNVLFDDNQLFVGDGERLAEHAGSDQRIVFLIEAEDATVKTVAFDDHERKLLRQTIPYSLEDDSVDDVDELHFSLGIANGDSMPLAIVSKNLLEKISSDLAQDEIEVGEFLSELHCIPWQENSWSLLVDGERWLVRSGQHEGFALQPEIACQAMQILLDGAGLTPQRLTIYCQQESQADVVEFIPDKLRGIVEWQMASYWQVMSQGFIDNEKIAINLLQGEFAPKLPWNKWWLNWRVVAAFLMTAILIQLVASYTELSVLEGRNIALRAEIEKHYRSAVPTGAVMDPERQLRRKVNALKGSNGAGFVALLVQIGPVLKTIDGVSLQSLNYSEKQSEFRLTILAPGFNDVETVRAGLEKLGLVAELTGSSADGSNTRARLRIRG